MSLSIITPHYNDVQGIKNTFEYLKSQSSTIWEWIIVDDASNKSEQQDLKEFITEIGRSNVKLVINEIKTSASICRNLGIDHSSHEKLVFLDSDDMISKDFVENRSIKNNEFVVFKNSMVINEHGEQILKSPPNDQYLDSFLMAKFIWPITAIVWSKSFLNKIGRFNEELQRLQDVELAIRALFLGKNFQVIDNEVDFYYNVSPIRSRKNFVPVVSSSVNILISILIDQYDLSSKQLKQISAYYFLCIKYLHRANDKSKVHHLKSNLRVFYKKKIIGFGKFLIGHLLLKLYRYNILSNEHFLRLNRFYFK